MGSTMRFLLLLALVSVTLAKVRYDGYQVYRIVPHTPEHVKVVLELENLGVS